MTKHIELDYHIARKKVVMGHLHAKYVCSHLQRPECLTKPLGKRAFTMFHFILRLQCMTLTSLRGADRSQTSSRFSSIIGFTTNQISSSPLEMNITVCKAIPMGLPSIILCMQGANGYSSSQNH